MISVTWYKYHLLLRLLRFTNETKNHILESSYRFFEWVSILLWMFLNSTNYSIMNEVLYKNIMAIELVCVSSSMCCLCWLCLHIVGCRLNIFSLLFQRKIHLSSSLLCVHIWNRKQNKFQNTSKQKHYLTIA